MTAEQVLSIARGELGTKESPANSNRVKYNTWYYGREVSGASYPWCMVFVQWVFDQAGLEPPIRTASCGALFRAAQSAGSAVYGDYRPGDVVIYDFPGGADTDHCGIVEAVSGSIVTAIEGNTSTGNDSDGGEVQRRTRRASSIVGAWRPEYQEDDMDISKLTDDQILELANRLNTVLAEQEPSSWSEEDREWAEDAGLIQGDEMGNKQYKAWTTRESMVTFLRRIVRMMKEG